MTKRFLFLIGCVVLLAGCSTVKDVFTSDDQEPLPGERISILELQRTIEPDNDALDAQGLVAPEPWRNEYWPQAGGYPNHTMQHLALNAGRLTKIWSTNIGSGTSTNLPLTAQPIVVDGRIFALDSKSTLTAFSIKDGKKLWRVDTSNPKEDEEAISGGISYSQGQLYVTAGYDEVLALTPESGALIWRVRIPSPARAAPTAMDGRVFVTTIDNRVLALNAADGQLLWDYTGVGESTGLVGAASPALSHEIVVPAFSSGEIFALRVENGAAAWSENLGSFRAAGGLNALSDIRGLPVVDKGVVIAISFGGRLIAIDERTGNRIWQREIGGSETPWVAGNYLFILSANNEIVALGRDNGVIRWVRALPRYKNPEDRKDAIFWTGPILAGGRLIAASTNGDIVEVSPENGDIIRTWSVSEPIAIAPIVAGETLYLLSEKGNLMAFK